MGKELKRVSDVIGDGKIDFYPDLAREDIEDILGKDVILMDARVMKDWPSDYGNGVSDWCLLMCQEVDTGREFTTACGGVVLTKRVGELLARKALPLVASVVKQGKSERSYYNVI